MVKNGTGVYQPVADVEGYEDIKINGSELVTVTINGVEKKSTFTTTGTVQTMSPLPVGGFKLVELGAPEGYIISQSEIEFVVTGKGVSMVTTASVLSFEADPGTGDPQLTIVNTPGAALPNTGGPGTRLFTFFGSVMIAGAGWLLWRRRRLI